MENSCGLWRVARAGEGFKGIFSDPTAAELAFFCHNVLCVACETSAKCHWPSGSNKKLTCVSWMEHPGPSTSGDSHRGCDVCLEGAADAVT